ncbi:zinc-dependent metalloprotease family protein [Botrimarina hoheduenensis]|nr:zinc-dependent metalloprotease family protein [Botrimarina hoheduenensis]
MTSCATAAVIVNSALPITKVVRVRLIRAAEDNGTNVANAFGSGSTKAYIEDQIDRIWAQAGIDIEFDTETPIYNSAFALRGNNGSGTRPQSDFNLIRNGAAAAGLTSTNANTLNMIMVDVVPGFAPLGNLSSAGLASLGGNGITGYAGDTLLTYNNGRDVIASVMAHEIGHNLGLQHTANSLANLMSPGGSTEQLSSSQIATALSSRFVFNLPPPLPGDYNGDNLVGVADYTVWRDGLGTPAEIGSYDEWASNYGDVRSTAVPEPAACALACVMALVGISRQSRAGIRRHPAAADAVG